MESCRNSNPFKLLWLYLLSARMKKIHPKMKVLEWSQHFSHKCCDHSSTYGDFSRRSRAANSEVRDGILPNSNSSELLWLVLLSARMKKIHPKMKVLEWSQHFSHYKSMEIFPDAQGQLISPWSDPAEFRTHSRFHGCPCYLQDSRRTNHK